MTPAFVRTAERIGLAVYVLVALFFMSRQFTGDVAGSARSTSSPPAASTAVGSAAPSTAAPTITATPSVVSTIAPTSSTRPTPDPLVVTAYQNGGRRYAALAVPVGYTLTSPIAGTASVVVYQFLGGDVRIGSNIPSEPFFPYVTITSADRRVILRPGALDRDVQLIVKDGQAVAIGTPLFTIVGEGASSWRTFYDRSVTAQVIASVAIRSSGAEVDPVSLFRR